MSTRSPRSFATCGAAISTVPPGVLGGAAVVLYGMIGLLGARIWVENRVDLGNPVNLMTCAVALIIGIADFTWQAGELTFTGIALGSIAALLVYHGMQLLTRLRGVGERGAARTPDPTSPVG